MIVITMRSSVQRITIGIASLTLLVGLCWLRPTWQLSQLEAAPQPRQPVPEQTSPRVRPKAAPTPNKPQNDKAKKREASAPREQAPQRREPAHVRAGQRPQPVKAQKRPKPQPKPPLQQLAELLVRPYNGHPDRHKSLIQALMQTPLSSKAVVRLASPLLNHKSWDVREKAAYTLSWLTHFLRDKATIQKLRDGSRHDSHWKVRAANLRALGVIHSEAKDSVLDSILYALRKDSYWQVRAQAAHSLSQLGGARIAKPKLWVAAINDPSWQVRSAVATVLQHIQPRNSQWVEALGLRLLDPEPAVRYAASQTLARLSNIALPLLVKMARSKHISARKHALSALACHAKHSSQALQSLRRALRDPQWRIAKEAASALSQVGPAAAPAIPDLIKLLHSKKTALRLMASWALQSIGKATLVYLRKSLQSEHHFTKMSAAETVGLLGPAAASAAPDLVDAMMDKEWKIRREATWALYRLGPKGASTIPMSMIPILINSVQDKQWSVRFVVSHVLGWMGPRGRMIIGWFGSRSVSTVGVLKQLSQSDKDDRVRQAAKQALQRVLAKTP
ncbi:MAG: HEAT repeat domain-containing protein [Deltaproteobacteria bacterium]|nr:MAG: HEAT repeat domain-containing protein [Deltaproteobacteria bacterium]